MRYGSLIICTVVLVVTAVDLTAQEQEETISPPEIPGCRIILADERLLASGQSGIISTMRVREGDRVREGQLLAEIDAAVPKASLAVAAKEAENDVDVRFAVVAAEVAKAEYALASEANSRQRGTFSRIELEKLRLERERSVLSIEVSEHNLAVSQLRRDEAQELVTSYSIVSPMSGVVSRMYKQAGEAVQAGESLLQCRNTEKLHVEADVDIGLLQFIRQGVEVRVIPKTPNPAVADPPEYVAGQVFFVDVVADAVSRTVRVLIEVDNDGGWLLAGTEASVQFLPQRSRNRAASADGPR